MAENPKADLDTLQYLLVKCLREIRDLNAREMALRSFVCLAAPFSPEEWDAAYADALAKFDARVTAEIGSDVDRATAAQTTEVLRLLREMPAGRPQ